MTIKKRKELYRNDSIVEKINLTNVEYNACVEQYPNMQTLLFDGEKIIDVQFCKKNCINPKVGLFAKNKKDSKTYKLFFIDKSSYAGSYSTELLFDDPCVDGIREKLIMNSTFSYHIESGELAIQLLLGDKDSYSSAFFLKRIQTKIDNCIKRFVLKSLMNKGLIETIQSLYSITNSIEEILNSEVLNSYGIQIDDLNIKIEENKKHFSRRNTLEWKLLEKEKLYANK